MLSGQKFLSKTGWKSLRGDAADINSEVNCCIIYCICKISITLIADSFTKSRRGTSNRTTHIDSLSNKMLIIRTNYFFNSIRMKSIVFILNHLKSLTVFNYNSYIVSCTTIIIRIMAQARIHIIKTKNSCKMTRRSNILIFDNLSCSTSRRFNKIIYWRSNATIDERVQNRSLEDTSSSIRFSTNIDSKLFKLLGINTLRSSACISKTMIISKIITCMFHDINSSISILHTCRFYIFQCYTR